MTEPRRLAYADPPYPGQALSRYAGHEVNLPLLIAHLRDFDGWALSTSTPALRQVWNLAPEARVAAWSKTWTKNGWARVRYTWEPVLFVTDRPGKPRADMSTVWDALVCAPDCTAGWHTDTGQGGGRKPYAFVRWMLDLLDYHPGDELTDLFPGSGAVTSAAHHEQLELTL